MTCRYLTCCHIKVGHMEALPLFWKLAIEEMFCTLVEPNQQSSDVIFKLYLPCSSHVFLCDLPDKSYLSLFLIAHLNDA